MSSDPFDRLRQLDPVARERVTPEDEARLDAILEGTLTVSRPSRRRLTVTAAASVVAVASIATAAWVVLQHDRPTEPTSVACYSEDDDDAAYAVVPRGDDAVEACETLWLNGTFGVGGAPDLTACVNDEGAAVAFPGGTEVCTRRGFALLVEGDGDPVESLARALTVEFRSECLGLDAASARVESLLAELDLDGWRLDVARSFSTERPCAGVAIDARERLLTLVPRRDLDLAPPGPVGP